MNLQTYSVSAIYALPAVYSDPFYAYKQRRVNYEDGLSLVEVDALSGVHSSTINNYSSQYLTSKKVYSEFLKVFKQESPLYTVTTPLVFNTILNNTNPQYLSIDTAGVAAVSGTNDYVASIFPTTSRSTAYDNNINFELEFLSTKFLRVKHNYNSRDFYLNCIPQCNELAFYSYTQSSDDIDINVERNDIFRYQLDDEGQLVLYKITANNVMQTVVYYNDKITVLPVNSPLISKNNSIIRINYNYTLIDPKDKTSWVSYKPTKVNDLTPEPAKSKFNLPSQYLLHTTYNLTNTDYFNLNLITLNNQRSEKGYVITGTNLLSGGINVPDVDFREYTSLFTGNNQEKGNKNIALNYVFFNKDLVIKSGTDTFFKTPENMYPFDKVNINDIDFRKNGSCGGPSPLVSDKIYLNRRYTTQYNDGRYLCTWLSGGSQDVPGVWLDRYYNDNSVEAPLIDFVSSLALEPSTLYKYERIGEQDINNIVNSSRPLLSGFDNYYNSSNVSIAYKSDSIIYDGVKYNKYNVSSAVNDSGQFTLCFDLFVKKNSEYGFQILGNKTNTGFGVRSDTVITPFIYTYQDNVMYVYNTDYVLISTTKFAQPIRDIIPDDPINNFFVICTNGYVYKVDPLGNKIKLEIISTLTAYKSYLQEEKTITFLINDLSDGNSSGVCVEIDKFSLAPLVVNSVKWPNFSDSPNSIFRYNGVLYNTPGRKVRYSGPKSDILYYDINDTIVTKHNLQSAKAPVDFIKVTSSLAAEGITITDFNVDYKSNVFIGYKNKVLIYDQNRKLVNTVKLDTISNVLSSEKTKILDIDFIREYKNGVPAYLTTVVVLNETSGIGFAKFDAYNDETPRVYVQTPLSGTYVPFSSEVKRYTQTNFQYNNRRYVENNLNFELTLTNYLSSEDIVVKNIAFDSSSLDEGFHNFVYRVDSVRGNITLLVDGVKYTSVSLQPGKYSLQTIFHDEIFIGSAGFFNGIDLATYLRQPGQYYIKGVQVKNLFFYNKVLSDTEMYAVNMYGKSIDDLVLAIPAGQRNNIEEIERLFKFSQNSSSNLVDIYIKNLNIEDIEFRQNIVSDILFRSQSLLPAGVHINEIKFIDYK